MRTLSTKVHEGTIDDIEKYQEEHDIESRSEAIRRLIRAGLEENAGRDKAAIQGILTGTMVIAFFSLASVGNIAPIYGVAATLAFLATLYYAKYSLSPPPILTD